MSAYAISLFRMLPSLSRVLSAINIISLYKKTLDMVHLEFNREVEFENTLENIRFNNLIELKNVSFLYPDADKTALNNINLCIHKGDNRRKYFNGYTYWTTFTNTWNITYR